MNKFFFTFDKTKKAQILRKKFLKEYDHYSLKQANIIVVGGGDGFMLHSLKKFVKHKKFFFGINCGTFGFLMNKNQDINLDKRVKTAKKIVVSPLEIKVKNKNTSKKLLAINELSLFRQSKQTVSLQIKLNKRILLKKLIGDGLIVSTPTGSTGYSLSCGGPVISPSCQSLVLTPISPHNLNARPLVISDSTKISISVSGREECHLLSIDSKVYTVNNETKILVEKSNFNIKVANLNNYNFYKTLKEKLLWGKDKRN